MFTSRHLIHLPAKCRSRRWMICCAMCLALGLAAGCVQKMDDQPIIEPLEANEFFSDGQGSREWIAGTVARGDEPNEIQSSSEHFTTGMVDNEVASTLPAELTENFTLEHILQRGRQRYAIFCSHCHDLQGTGQGVVPQRGFPEPPTYHSNRLREASLGHFYRVISHGRGQMPAHGGQIPPSDRWAIAAYVRALQVSQHVDASRLEPAEVERLQSPSQSTAIEEVPDR
jgi:mono/diheme cytochrome c family protein